jgi:hypothetical protein
MGGLAMSYNAIKIIAIAAGTLVALRFIVFWDE